MGMAFGFRENLPVSERKDTSGGEGEPGGRQTIAQCVSTGTRRETVQPRNGAKGRPVQRRSYAPFRGLRSRPCFPDGLRRGLLSFAPPELDPLPTLDRAPRGSDNDSIRATIAGKLP